MKSQHLALAGLLAASMACSGAPDPSTANDGGIDVAPAEARTFDYVVSALGIEDSNELWDRGVSGFNVDGRFSTHRSRQLLDCDRVDSVSPLDSDQNMGSCVTGMPGGGAGCLGGVDNQLPELTYTIISLRSNTDPREQLQRRIARGTLAVLVRVEGVNGEPSPTLYDDHVTVTVYPFARPMNGRCFVAGQPGQRFQIDSESLVSDGSRPRYRFEGSIVRGRLRVSDTDYTRPGLILSIPLDDTVSLSFRLYGFQFRANLGILGATGGNLGGFVLYPEFAQTLLDTPGAVSREVLPSTVRSLLRGFADIATDAENRPGVGGCAGPDRGGLGIGMAFTLTAVVIDPTVARDGPVVDCDAGVGGDGG